MRNMSEHSTVEIKDTTSNPAPLGLLGFGMTTVLLNLHNSGVYALGSMILAMGLVYGGLAQVIAGIMEWKKGNTFGSVAFTSYGLFWWSLVLLVVLPGISGFEAFVVTNEAKVAYLIMWGIFTSFMFLGTFKSNLATMFVFLSLAVLFFLLAIADATGSAAIGVIAGIEGIICGSSAIYTAFAEILNEKYGKTVLPLFPVKS
ncbi:acetate uptake transporter [Candidatus Harpocratesius sp.]